MKDPQPKHDFPKAIEEQLQDWIREYSGEAVVLAHLLCHRHAKDPEKVALFYEDADGNGGKYTFSELRERSARCAGMLRDLGVGKEDRVATLLPRTPALLS